jgi:hypothetical protein
MDANDLITQWYCHPNRKTLINSLITDRKYKSSIKNLLEEKADLIEKFGYNHIQITTLQTESKQIQQQINKVNTVLNDLYNHYTDIDQSKKTTTDPKDKYINNLFQNFAEIQQNNENEIQQNNENEILQNNENENQQNNENENQQNNENEILQNNENENQENNENEKQENNENGNQENNENEKQENYENENQQNNENENQQNNENENQENNENENQENNETQQNHEKNDENVNNDKDKYESSDNKKHVENNDQDECESSDNKKHVENNDQDECESSENSKYFESMDRETKETKQTKEMKETKETKETNEMKETKETNEMKETKETKEMKEKVMMEKVMEETKRKNRELQRKLKFIKTMKDEIVQPGKLVEQNRIRNELKKYYKINFDNLKTVESITLSHESPYKLKILSNNVLRLRFNSTVKSAYQRTLAILKYLDKCDAVPPVLHFDTERLTICFPYLGQLMNKSNHDKIMGNILKKLKKNWGVYLLKDGQVQNKMPPNSGMINPIDENVAWLFDFTNPNWVVDRDTTYLMSN